MRPLIHAVFTQLLICFAVLPVSAGTGLPKPTGVAAIALRPIQQLDSILAISPTHFPADKPSTSPEAKESIGRICSCQVLNLESSNYSHRFVVLLAEKTNSGRDADFRAARNRIQLEKRQLKKLFYDKVKVLSELQSTGSCRSLYFRLRAVDSHLQLYEILNAD